MFSDSSADIAVTPCSARAATRDRPDRRPPRAAGRSGADRTGYASLAKEARASVAHVESRAHPIPAIGTPRRTVTRSDERDAADSQKRVLDDLRLQFDLPRIRDVRVQASRRTPGRPPIAPIERRLENLDGIRKGHSLLRAGHASGQPLARDGARHEHDLPLMPRDHPSPGGRLLREDGYDFSDGYAHTPKCKATPVCCSVSVIPGCSQYWVLGPGSGARCSVLGARCSVLGAERQPTNRRQPPPFSIPRRNSEANVKDFVGFESSRASCSAERNRHSLFHFRPAIGLCTVLEYRYRVPNPNTGTEHWRVSNTYVAIEFRDVRFTYGGRPSSTASTCARGGTIGRSLDEAAPARRRC